MAHEIKPMSTHSEKFSMIHVMIIMIMMMVLMHVMDGWDKMVWRSVAGIEFVETGEGKKYMELFEMLIFWPK